MLHKTSTTGIDMNGEKINRIVPKEIKLLDTKLAALEGTVISIDISSLTVKSTYVPSILHLLRQILVSNCCSSCKMMGTMESVTTSKPKMSFCFKDMENRNNFKVDASILENFTVHTVLNKVNSAKHFCKMPSFFVKVSNNVVTRMKSNEVNPATHMHNNKDTDVASQHN